MPKPDAPKEEPEDAERCPKCGAFIDEGAPFCPACGCNVAVAKKQAERDAAPKRKKKIDKELKRIAGEQAVLCTNDLAGFQLMFEDGLAESVEGTFSRTLEFTDVSYENEREDQQDAIFDKLCSLHHFFQSPECYQLNLVNVPRTTRRVERYLPETGANKDMAVSYNDLIEQKQREGRVEFERRNFLTFSVPAASAEQAAVRLRALREGATAQLAHMESKATPLDGLERASLIHDLLVGPGKLFTLDYEKLAKTKKTHVRDYVAPAWAVYPPEERTLRRTLQMPGIFVKTLHIKDFGSDLQDSALRQIRRLPVPMNISLLFQPQKKSKMVQTVRQNIDVTQAEMQDYAQAVGKSGGDPTLLPPAMEDREMEGRELLDFIRNKDQQIAWFQGFITVYGKSLADVERNANLVMDECSTWTLEATELPLQQEQALMGALPLATPRLSKKYRSLTNAEAAALVPFSSQNVCDDPAKSYRLGVNEVSGEQILVDPDKTKSPHMWVFGMTGSGKGMEMNSIVTYSLLQHPRTALDKETGRYVCDDPNAPEWHFMDWHDEYWELGDLFDASEPQFGPGHDSCINVMDMSGTMGDLSRRDVQANADVFIAIMESCMKGDSLTNAQMTALDEAVRAAYEPHIGRPTRPDLTDLYRELRRSGEAGNRSAVDLADALGVYVNGSFNSFAGQTNIEVNPLMNVYRMSEVGKNMRTLAVLAVLQHVRQRAYENYRHGKQTYLVFEECQIVFDNAPAMDVLMTFFSEMRKFGLKMICVTQLPNAVLSHPDASKLFENSGIFVFLAQQAQNQDTLARMFKLSESQYDRLSASAPKGTGLVVVDGLKIAMNNVIDSKNPLYEVWNTDPDKYAAKLKATQAV